MTRHGKNCTAGTVYTYHEKKKDTSQSGYGTQSIRLGKDSIQEFDCCCLSLQPCRNPVVTPDGFLYDKESILEYIVHQKREIARKLKDFEKQKNREQKEAAELKKAEGESKLKKFVTVENCITGKVTAPVASSGLSNMADGKDKSLPSFWVPCLTPAAKASAIVKPDEKVRCPMSGKPIKLRDLTDVKFIRAKDDDKDKKKSLIAKEVRYVCAVTGDVLGNSVPCAVLKTSGNVVTMECLDKIIRKEMIDPTNGKKLNEKDIIQLQRGATGFAGAGVTLAAKKDGPALMA